MMTPHPMYTILIVDDTASNRFTLRSLLESSLDVEVLEAENGQEALDVVSNRPSIDLILLDVQMPGMNGFEVAQLLRSRKKYSSIPIVFLTAVYTADDFKYEGLKQGAIDYLTKPIDDTILLNRIKAHLRLLENERAMNRRLEELNAQLQQEIEERRRAEQELRDAKNAALRAKDRAEAAEQRALDAQQAEQEARLEAEEARSAAESANRAKSAFLRTMSHELKTPLNGVLGYAQILQQDEQLTPNQRDHIDIIQRSGEHLLTLVNDILDISDIDTGRLQLAPTAFHLSPLLQNLVEMAEIQAHIKGLRIESQLPEALPNVVYGDECRLRQVLLHLLGNAIKFTSQGSVTFHVQQQEVAGPIDTDEQSSSAPVVRFRFSIADTGIGIAPEAIERIFQPFERLSDTDSYTEGAGLGLALSQHLLQLMHSSLHVESQPGQGSTFWFELDLATGSPLSNDVSTCQSFIMKQSEAILEPLPPEAVLTSLFEAATIGDITEILAQLQRLEQQGAEYQPFIQTIRTLAQSFKVKHICHLIETARHQNS